ncbi:hypothetical protein [Cohnella caldifontis]|uniref:hypothetical protein n=1 Tax=Cohnella caldifontis TaxID=3027471 RepID=UPI0023ED62B9|nr:hypothetical protein [Cohnella sp. YIM B05605]
MRAIESYRDETNRIFAEAAEEIAAFPAGLSGIGLDMLARCDPSKNGGKTNGISYLLPYWFRERTGGPIELCRDLAVGSLLMMLHYFVLDDAMDRGTDTRHGGIRWPLALGQLLQERFRQRYEWHFPSGSPLWDYYRKYLQEWAFAVHREPEIQANPREIGQLAGKAAPVKIGAAGMLLRAGQAEGIPDAEEAVELALAVLQLSDDWADWREDLPESNRNAFLTLVRERLSMSASDPLDERSVRQAIFRHQALDKLADIAEAYGERLGRSSCAPVDLIDFLSTIAKDIRKGAITAEESTRRLADGGGLDYYLSKF